MTPAGPHPYELSGQRGEGHSGAGLGILVAPVPISPVVCISLFALCVGVSRWKSPGEQDVPGHQVGKAGSLGVGPGQSWDRTLVTLSPAQPLPCLTSRWTHPTLILRGSWPEYQLLTGICEPSLIALLS